MPCSAECRKPNGRQAHCSVCHRTFTGVTVFDDHRVAGACADRAGVTERNGLWGNWGSNSRRWWE